VKYEKSFGLFENHCRKFNYDGLQETFRLVVQVMHIWHGWEFIEWHIEHVK
jgi:hypothetical protein